MTTLSHLLPFADMPRHDIHAFARAVQATPGARLWHGQTSSADPSHVFVEAAGAGIPVPAGIGVTLTPLRHPFEAAIQARSLASRTGRSLVAGFGPGAQAFQQALLGSAYASPLTLMREYLETVRDLVAGRAVSRRGEYVTCEGSLSGEPGPPIEIGAGVLRPRMARVAGEVSDVAITWMTPASYIAGTLRPAVAEGADRAGRPRPRIVAMIGIGSCDRPLAHQIMAAHGRHLRQQHYLDMLRAAGIDPAAGGFRAMADAVAAGGAFLHGTADEVADGLRAFTEAGVDEVVLNLSARCALDGVGAALTDAAAIVEAFDPAHTAPTERPTTHPMEDRHDVPAR